MALVLLAAGRDADVFALDDYRVLRRYRDGFDVAVEAAMMAYLAKTGFPVPQVHDATGPDLVLERIDGPTMATALLCGGLDIAAAAGCSPTCTGGYTSCRRRPATTQCSESCTLTCTRRT